MSTSAIDGSSPFDDAYDAADVAMVGRSGAETLEVVGWSREPDLVDHALFLDHCHGATLDVGCGPGRLVGHLTSRGVPAMGIDVSEEAVRQARVRGATAMRLDVFDPIPGEGRWDHVLLADGNVGIGGDPVRLLTRLAALLAPDGSIIVEVADAGCGILRERRRLRIDGVLTEPFEWAVVGAEALDGVARHAGFSVRGTRTVGGRHAAILDRRRP